MSKASPIQESFNAGELSPLMESRVTVAKRANGCTLLDNLVPTIQGPLVSRPGAKFVNQVKNRLDPIVLIPFEFNVEQAYILEFGDLYMRVYKDHGIIESSPSVPVEIVTPYAKADLFDSEGRTRLQWAQTADIMYLTHADHPVQELSRTSDIAWTIASSEFKDGPFEKENTDTTKTMTRSGTAVGATITVTATGHAPFVSTDVGRLIRFTDGTTRASVKITGFTSSTIVTAAVGEVALGGTGAISKWRLGIFSETTGYPTTITFFEDRMFLAGSRSNPQRIDGSEVGDHLSFSPTETDGSVIDNNAIGVALNADKVNAIVWVTDDERGLMIGTAGGEWVMSPSSSGEALTPVNIKAVRATTYGSAAVKPIRTGKATLYVQRSSRKLREMAFVFESDGFRSPDMTILSEHITGDGILHMAYQQEPHSIVWCLRKDGSLIGFTYDRDQDVLAWHRHNLAGASDAGGTAAIIESIAAIPTPDEKSDELWVSVKRWVNGQEERYIEFITEFWRESFDQEDAFCVDSGLTYDSTPATTISGLDHLEGQLVRILADGAAHPDKTVTSGSVTLDRLSSVVHLGLPYIPSFKSLRFDSGAKDGTSQGKTKRINNVTVRFYQTLGAFIGPSQSEMDEINFREGDDLMDVAPPLFDGDKRVNWQGSYDNDGFIIIEQRQPLPMTIIAVMPQGHTQDRS